MKPIYESMRKLNKIVTISYLLIWVIIVSQKLPSQKLFSSAKWFKCILNEIK